MEAGMRGLVRLRFSLRFLLLVPAFVGACLAGLWWWPKSQPLSVNEQYYRGYYRGLGLSDQRGFLGKNFYRVVVQDIDEGYWEVWFREAGYSPYRGYYPNGTMREEGECLVEFVGFGGNEPVPDRHAVRWGKYYLPDGRLGSEVKNGSGIQTYWYSDGTECWELELRDFKRRRLMWRKPDGTLFTQEEYDRDGRWLPPPPRVP
jgi:hypothetical protein